MIKNQMVAIGEKPGKSFASSEWTKFDLLRQKDWAVCSPNCYLITQGHPMILEVPFQIKQLNKPLKWCFSKYWEFPIPERPFLGECFINLLK